MPSTLTTTDLAATTNGRPDHPLAALTSDEIVRAAEVVRAAGRLTDGARFASIVLHEPAKATVSSWRPGDPIDREVRCTIVPGPAAELVEAVVSVTKGELRSWTELADTRPAILFEEAITAIVAAAADRAPLPLPPPKPTPKLKPPMMRMWGKPRTRRKAVVRRFLSVSWGSTSNATG